MVATYNFGSVYNMYTCVVIHVFSASANVTSSNIIPLTTQNTSFYGSIESSVSIRVWQYHLAV